MRTIRYLLPLVGLVALLCAGCDAIHKRLTGPYILIAVDTDEQLNVARESSTERGLSIGRIGPVVTSVAWNDKYIVATVRPQEKPGAPPSYYYLDIAKDSESGDQYKAVTGPLSKEAFEKVRKESRLPDFSLHYRRLE